jgi:hypothetical protein
VITRNPLDRVDVAREKVPARASLGRSGGSPPALGA